VEVKVDGQRGIAIADAGSVRLLSRNGADITRTFPKWRRRFLALGLGVGRARRGDRRTGRKRRSVVQPASAAVATDRRPSTELLRQVPTRFYAFDVLHTNSDEFT
jgi:bifunctional non-homologous end joining protein LigD